MLSAHGNCMRAEFVTAFSHLCVLYSDSTITLLIPHPAGPSLSDGPLSTLGPMCDSSCLFPRGQESQSRLSFWVFETVSYVAKAGLELTV